MLLGAMPEDLVVPTGKSQRATDFSIAAIMAKNASPSDRDGVGGRELQADGVLSHLSSIEDEDPLEDDEIEVDVEECSDTESTRPTKPKLRRHSPSVSDCGSEPTDIDRESPDLVSAKSPSPKKTKILCNCEELLNVDCHLETKDLWDKFHDLGTEMIITKTGRIFPCDEHGERFHLGIVNMERRYQGKWNVAMSADYCWTLLRDDPEAVYKREAKKRKKRD